MACRLAGASNLESFWKQLLSQHDPFVPLPGARFDAEIFAREAPNGKLDEVRGALVNDFGLDWRSLRIPPAQVERLHRVERLALSVMGDALADAEIGPDRRPVERGAIWCAASTIGSDPWLDPIARIRRVELVAPLCEALEAQLPARAAELRDVIERVSELGAPPLEPDVLMISACIMAGRASQIYDFKGGHVAVDVGMCSSLAAIAKAVASLQTGGCDLALVCAAAPLVTPSAILAYAHRGQLGKTRPRPFAADAGGTLLGDGAMAIVLERVDDVGPKRIYAAIESVASSTLADAPANALSDCVAEAASRALAQARLSPREVGPIESRACGVSAVDGAEAQGLSAVYSDKEAPKSLTSSVPTFGFLQAASGMVAFMKTALAIHHRCWPGQATTNAEGDSISGLRIPRTADNWTGTRRAAVSDAGPECIAYHAILADARDRRLVPRPARRVTEHEPIAIVGAGVVAPGAGNLETFWNNALAGVNTYADLPKSRWSVDRIVGSSRELARAFKTSLASTVDLTTLDGERLSGAKTLDPSTLLALHAVEQAIADAGLKRGAWASDRVNLVLGQISLRVAEIATEKRVQYAMLAALAGEAMREAGVNERAILAVTLDAQGRFDRENGRFSSDTLAAFSSFPTALSVAKQVGLSGEVVSVDAACASSLAALKLATDSLLARDADVVIAAGVSFHLVPEYYVALGLLDALSTRAGRPYHRDADGFVPAEAAGAVVLKRLSDARRDGDHIYATVVGHGISSDGRGLSIYSPNPAGQSLAMSRALAAADLQATTIDAIEAHGPGAPLGDRAEMVSIASTYGSRPFGSSLSIASAKSLIGHSSSAGAMISLIRAALALASKVLPPSDGNGDVVPDLPFGPTLRLSRVARAWVESTGHPRRAAVNAFGMTGVNHHVLLEEASPEPTRKGVPKAALEHPVTRPAHKLSADRFVLSEVPVSLPQREPQYALRGKNIAIIPDGGSLHRELERLLTARGARTVRLELAEALSSNDISAALSGHLDSLDGVIDLSGFGVEGDQARLSAPQLRARLLSMSTRSFAILREVYERFSGSRSEPACYVAVTSIGGSGDGAAVIQDPMGAFFQGLARALKQEIPTLLCKAIDVAPLSPIAQTAANVVREIEDGSDRVDVRYSERRLLTLLRLANFAPAAPVLRRLDPNDVFVFSGGGRGVVYQCAVALARLGVNVIVTGRRPLPKVSEPWLTLSETDFADFRRAELIRRRGTEGPASIIRSLNDMDSQRQAFSNISAAQTADLPLSYEACDVTDAASVAAVMARVRARFGHIDGVGHGAMIEQSTLLPRKSPQIIEATLLTKVLGLSNLVEATKDDRLKVFVGFGSGVGRYGNSGQTDYAASNALLATWLQAYGQGPLKDTHCVTIDWPAWESLGATANPDVANLLRTAGVTSISPEEGSYWFLSELYLGNVAESVICGEAMLSGWPFLARDADGSAERAIEVDDKGDVLLPSRWPMLDRVVDVRGESMTLERVFSVERDAYLPQHLLNGIPVLPATFGCEVLGEAALLACPGFNVHSIEDFHVDAPLGLARSMPVNARVLANFLEMTETRRVVGCELRTALVSKVATQSHDRIHHGARVMLARHAPPSLGRLELPRLSKPAHSNSFYELLRDPVCLGPMFFGAHWIQIRDNVAIGTVEPPDSHSTFSHISAPSLVACPLVIDAALQVAGSWDGYQNGYASVPVGIQTIVLGRKPERDERTKVLATVLRVEHPHVYYDIHIVGEGSELLVQLRNVQLRRLGAPTANA